MFDRCRPISAIQCQFGGEKYKLWAGHYKGIKVLDANRFYPYQSYNFVTPPFAEYVSGHSTFSAAMAEVMKLYLGDDNYGGKWICEKGKSFYEPKIVKGEEGYIAGVTDVPNSGPYSVGYVPRKDIVLKWKTFTDAANESGYSRLLGGVHPNSGNVEGLKMGRKIGKTVFKKAIKLFNGKI